MTSQITTLKLFQPGPRERKLQYFILALQKIVPAIQLDNNQVLHQCLDG